MGHVYASDYVLDETVALTRSRTGGFEDSEAVADRILGREQFVPAVDVLFVGDAHYTGLSTSSRGTPIIRSRSPTPRRSR